MYIYVHIYMYVCIYVYIHNMNIYICIHTYIYILYIYTLYTCYTEIPCFPEDQTHYSAARTLADHKVQNYENSMEKVCMRVWVGGWVGVVGCVFSSFCF
jgi:hypothetical protein